MSEQTRGWVAATLGALRGKALRTASEREALSTNFGRIVRRTPTLGVEPQDADDLVAVLRAVGEFGVAVTTRGAGHSQFGQGLLGDALRHGDVAFIPCRPPVRSRWALESGLRVVAAARRERGILK